MIRKRIAFVVADPSTAQAFLTGHMRELSLTYDIALIADTRDGEYLRTLGIDGDTFPVAIARDIRPLHDLRALIGLIRLFRRHRFDAVHSVTPKAGLLAMSAAAIAGVPLRTHTFTGQVWATMTGFKRRLLRRLDALTHRLCTFSLVDSFSQRDFLIAESVLLADRSGVLADGSIAGVDTSRFRPNEEAREDIRKRLSVSDDQILFFFLGRLKAEKGVLDLAQAFADVHAGHAPARLLFVGPDEEGLEPRIKQLAGSHFSACTLIEATDRPEIYMAAADIFCLPSYREGFGSVLVEAAATGLPSIASRIYGIDDAVVDGTTGLLHPPRDVPAIADLMTRLIAFPELRAALGAAGRARVLDKFRSERLIQAMTDYYRDRLPV